MPHAVCAAIRRLHGGTGAGALPAARLAGLSCNLHYPRLALRLPATGQLEVRTHPLHTPQTCRQNAPLCVAPSLFSASYKRAALWDQPGACGCVRASELNCQGLLGLGRTAPAAAASSGGLLMAAPQAGPGLLAQQAGGLRLLGGHGGHADGPLLGQRLGAALALLLQALHQQLVVLSGLRRGRGGEGTRRQEGMSAWEHAGKRFLGSLPGVRRAGCRGAPNLHPRKAAHFPHTPAST